MARSLDQIISELQSTYDPQVATLRQRQEAIPGQVASEEAGLQAKQGQAFDDITNGARRRGLGFSGIPLAEQARYTSTEFLPAVARLHQSGQEQATSLEDMINQVLERRNTTAQQLYQGDLDRDQQQRQFEQQLAAQRQAQAAAQATYGSLGGSNAPAAPTVSPEQQAAYNIEQGLKRAAGDNGELYTQTANQLRTKARTGDQDAIYKLKLLAQFRQTATGIYPKGLFAGVRM